MTLNANDFFDFDAEHKLIHNAACTKFTLSYFKDLCWLDMEFQLSKYTDFNTLKLRIDSLIEFVFVQNIDSLEEQIHTYKFLKKKSLFYLSLDPYEGVEGISDKDLDIFVFAECMATIQ